MALGNKDALMILVAGAVGVMIAPIILPTILRLGRPVAKSAIKASIMLYQQAREGAAEFVETLEDLAAEAQAEIAAEATEAPSAAAPAVIE